MQIRRHLTAPHFLHHCQAFLEKEESRNNLMLGLVLRYAEQEGFHRDDCLLYEFSDEEQPQFCCLQTPGRRMLIYGGEGVWERWIPLVVANIRGLHPDLPGVMGPEAQANAFADLWGGNQRQLTAMAILTARKILNPPASEGRGRMATMVDLETVSSWYHAFAKAVLQDEPEVTIEAAIKICRESIAKEAVAIWETEGPVSMAISHRQTRNTASISYVYTPPEQRNRGYASHVTAFLSRIRLAQGKQEINLFTNVSNPTSNKIYKSIGFAEIGRFANYAFGNEG